MKKLLTIFVFLLLCTTGFSQKDSSRLRISVLTCGPGSELYSTFGHSGIRVIDSAIYLDKVYNYGTFEFNDDFYVNFVKGRLYYFVNADDYTDFLESYKYEDRSVEEQVLNLSQQEKSDLYAALKQNAREENKYYQYDYLYDNCATKIRDIIRKHIAGNVQIKYILPAEDVSFRDLIHYDLDQNKLYWSKLGIDLLLGKGLDKKVKNEESMFLPKYLYKGFDSASVGNMPLVQSKNVIYATKNPDKSSDNFFSPFVSFSALLILFFLVGRLRSKAALGALWIMDKTLFLLTGLLGVFMVVMWVGTDHYLCANNFNILWAIPLHAAAVFFSSKRCYVKSYWRAVFYLYILLLLSWTFLPQDLNRDLFPLVVLLAWRSWAMSRIKK